MKFRKMFLLIAALLVAPAIASASLGEFFSATGKLTLSVDGAGSNNANGHSIQVEKPNASATVRKAFVMAASFCGNNSIPDNAVSINGTPITWDQSFSNPTPTGITFFNVRSDITSFVKPIV